MFTIYELLTRKKLIKVRPSPCVGAACLTIQPASTTGRSPKLVVVAHSLLWCKVSDSCECPYGRVADSGGINYIAPIFRLVELWTSRATPICSDVSFIFSSTCRWRVMGKAFSCRKMSRDIKLYVGTKLYRRSWGKANKINNIVQWVI